MPPTPASTCAPACATELQTLALALPRTALADLLGPVPPPPPDGDPHLFRSAVADLGPDEGRLDSAFIPSAEGLCRRPRAPACGGGSGRSRSLRLGGGALLRGVGASGKTVLAWLLALDTLRDVPGAAYDLDLAGYTDTGPDCARGTDWSRTSKRSPSAGALFILDNCHLDEALAKELARALGGPGARTGRPRRPPGGRNPRTARGSPIDGLSVTDHSAARTPGRSCSASIGGSLRRRTADADPPLPPDDVLNEWVLNLWRRARTARDTTCDLIAFSAAVVRRLPRLLQRDWTLTA